MNKIHRYLYYSFGFLALSASISVFCFLEEREDSLGIHLSAPMLCIGMFFLLKAAYLSQISLKVVFAPSIYQVYVFFMVWSVLTILRGFSFDYKAIRDMWGISLYAWAYLVPVAMILGTSLWLWSRVFVLHYVLGCFGILAFPLCYLAFQKPHDLNMAYGCVVLLLFFPFLPFRKSTYRWVVFTGTVVTLLTSIFALRRNQVIAKGMFILFACAILFFRKHRLQALSSYLVLAVLVGLVSLVVYVGAVDRVSFLPDVLNERIDMFKEKLPKNTRFSYSHNMYLEFLEDMKGTDFLIGRGCLGEYSGFVGSKTGDDIDRRNIECGYFQVVLKGGVVMLIPMIGMALSAVWLGLFRSQNWFAKACAFIVLARLIEMVPYGLPQANIPYVIFWMAIGACLTKQIRDYSDSAIQTILWKQ